MKKIELKKFNEIIYYDKCDNGLPVYMWVNNRVNNFYATLSVNYGSIDTNFKIDKKNYKVPNGVAHFLEHVKFNEGPNKTAHDYFNKLGSSINAFTTFEYTSYEVFGSSNIKDNIEHLLDYVQKPYFTKELIEKEKGIIKEEVKMGKNNPASKMYFKFNNNLFYYNNRKYLVTGEIKDVDSITLDDVKLVYDTFYHPSNMFMVVTGNFNPYEVITIIKENQDKKTFARYLNPVKIYKKDKVSVVKQDDIIEENINIPKLKIGYKLDKNKFKKFNIQQILLYTKIILNANFGSTSDLREELLERQLITSLMTNSSIIDDYLILNITVETKYPNELIKIIKNKMNNLSLSKKRLDRRIKCNIADCIYGFDNIEYVNSMIQDNLITYHKILDNLYNDLKSLNIEDANEIIKLMKSDNVTTLIMNPIEKS